MEFEVELGKKAQRDLLYAYLWYEKRKIGLGEKFIQEVEAGVEYLKQNPEAFPEKKKGFREFNLKAFPYLMIYILKDNKVHILAIFHTRLDPNRKPSA